jgi:hypothetical protein
LWRNHFYKWRCVWNFLPIFSHSKVPIAGQEAVPWAQKLQVNFSKETTVNKIPAKCQCLPAIILASTSISSYDEFPSFWFDS